MTNNRTVKDERRFATEGSTERLSGQEAGVVMTFSANRSKKKFWQIVSRQIVSWQIALRKIATHPINLSIYLQKNSQKY